MNDSLTDSVETKPKLVPELRFPEFENDGEWDLKLFSKFIKLDRGSSPRPIQEYLTQDESGVNWIKIGDTKNAVNSIIYQVEEKITSIGAQKSRRVEKGELILANSMSFGKTYELAIEGCIYDGWFVLRKYEKHFIKQFLLQMLNSDYMQNQYKRLSAGGIVQNISSDIVYNSQLFHTSISEQEKIASCLSSLDELITATREKLEALQAHKKGLIQNLFPQEGQTVPNYRFPEFEDDGDWVERKLGDKEVSFFVGEKISVDKLTIDSYVSTENMLPDYSGVKAASKLPTSGSFTKFKNGDILISNIRPYLKKVWKSDKSGGASNDVFVFRSGAHVESEFLEFIIKNDDFINYVMKSVKGVKMPRGDKASMREYSVFIPSKLEQQKISNCLSLVDELIASQTEKIDRLLQHKKGLMQGLFPKNLD